MSPGLGNNIDVGIISGCRVFELCTYKPTEGLSLFPVFRAILGHVELEADAAALPTTAR